MIPTKEILDLRELGYSIRDIAAMTGQTKHTVQSVTQAAAKDATALPMTSNESFLYQNRSPQVEPTPLAQTNEERIEAAVNKHLAQKNDRVKEALTNDYNKLIKELLDHDDHSWTIPQLREYVGRATLLLGNVSVFCMQNHLDSESVFIWQNLTWLIGELKRFVDKKSEFQRFLLDIDKDGVKYLHSILAKDFDRPAEQYKTAPIVRWYARIDEVSSGFLGMYSDEKLIIYTQLDDEDE